MGERQDFKVFFETFSLPFPEGLMTEEARAINGWGQRRFPQQKDPAWAVGWLQEVLRDAHIVGKNPSFDVEFLKALFAQFGVEPTWHHRLVDVGPLAWGYYNRGHSEDYDDGPQLQPPNVDEVGELLFMPRETHEGFHTALSDAQWAWRVFRKVVPYA